MATRSDFTGENPHNSMRPADAIVGLQFTSGDNYTNPDKPRNVRLSVSPAGITSQEKDLQIARYKNIGNAWDVVAAQQDTLKKKHNAHQKLFEAGQAQIGAATALTKSSTSWNKYQTAIAENRISRNEARNAIAAIPIEIERQNVDLQKKRESLTKAKMELEELMTSNQVKRQDLDHQTILRQIDGIEVQVALPDLMQNISGLLPPNPELVMLH